MDLISIVTSVYNKADCLERFFDAVKSQSYANLEIVAVNNGSTDESPSILRAHALQDSRIRIIDIADNNGPASGYARGIEAVSGDCFCLVDADDDFNADYIEKLHAALVAHEADVAMCVNDIVWEDGRRYHKPWPEQDVRVIEGEEACRLPLQLLDELNRKYFGCPMPEIGAMWCKMYRTSLIRDHHLNLEDGLWVWCDFVFHLQVMQQVKKMVYIKTTCYHNRMSEDSVTRPKSFQENSVIRILQGTDRIHEVCLGMRVPGLEEASNRFYFNRIREIANIYYAACSSGVLTRKQLDERMDRVMEHPFARQLCSSGRLPDKTWKEGFQLFAWQHHLTAQTYLKKRLETRVKALLHRS